LLVDQIARAATSVEGVRAIEKLVVRRLGIDYFVDLHVQADPTLPLREAHILSGKVKGAIRSTIPCVSRVLIHMEPYEGGGEFTEPEPAASQQRTSLGDR
jgi:divalent metal cation (Fe/Co/Zn/Cd) transporter